MGDKLRVFHNNNLDGPYSPDKYSETTKTMIDEESLKLVDIAFIEAVQVIKKEKTYFEFLVNSLLEKKILFLNDFETLNITHKS